MDEVKKKQVLEILDYWKIIEFLNQEDIPEEKDKNRKIIKSIQEGMDVNNDKIEIFSNLSSSSFSKEKQLDDDSIKFVNYPCVGKKISFCMGKIERNIVVKYLEKYIDNVENNPRKKLPMLFYLCNKINIIAFHC